MRRSSAIDQAPESPGNASASAGVTTGRAFAEALARKNFDAVTALLDPHIDFGGLTPGRAWEASGARRVVDDVLRQWFEDSDELEQVLSIETGSVADRERVTFRFRGQMPTDRSSSAAFYLAAGFDSVEPVKIPLGAAPVWWRGGGGGGQARWLDPRPAW